ncbi:hypothetical protein AKJ62_01960 [candidate division MSBL1 archaeon SCGC-AAA259D14]|uniref:Uncharacterized protein n=1 Tax=candidate division MSBL1 archaeon SCGC-AAA259D14 TaxID=1698261 RepID=A0A133U734_9EURY|nr:hypothetical protein AKJ62_01960 [candidate division MSBL1 archaeon SCGC-AAA259D14]
MSPGLRGRWKMIVENLLLLATILLGGLGIWFYSPWLSLLYFGFAGVVHLFVLRKLICINCIHFKDGCHIGWNRIAFALFSKGSIENFEERMNKIGAPIWIVTFIWPIIALARTLITSFSVSLAFITVFYLLLVIASLFSLGKLGCSNCEMSKKCLIGKICPVKSVKRR